MDLRYLVRQTGSVLGFALSRVKTVWTCLESVFGEVMIFTFITMHYQRQYLAEAFLLFFGFLRQKTIHVSSSKLWLFSNIFTHWFNPIARFSGRSHATLINVILSTFIL